MKDRRVDWGTHANARLVKNENAADATPSEPYTAM